MFHVLLRDVLCAQNLMYNLISLSQAEGNIFNAFTDNHCVNPTSGAVKLMHKPFQDVRIVDFEASDVLYEAAVKVCGVFKNSVIE